MRTALANASYKVARAFMDWKDLSLQEPPPAIELLGRYWAQLLAAEEVFRKEVQYVLDAEAVEPCKDCGKDE